MKYLSIKNFKKHQHYKNRRPPWIKLHVEVLDDYAFGCLQDASKAHLMLLWVLASKHDNKIPYDLAWITQKINSTTPVDVEELVLHGFIEVGEDASNPLATREQNSILETETETEKKKKEHPDSGESASRKSKPRAKGSRKHPHFPTEAALELTQAWRQHLDPTMDMGRLISALTGLYPEGGPLFTVAELTDAMTVYSEVRQTKPVDQWRWWHPNDFAKTASEWVRLGRMPAQDQFGQFTERGRLAMRGVA